MITHQLASQCLESAAAELKGLSYKELEAFVKTHFKFNSWQSREVRIEKQAVSVNTLICKLGRLNKRISVELTLSAECGVLPSDTPCCYFERYETGRLYVPRAKTWEVVFFKVLSFAFFGGVVIALLILGRYLLLRAK